MDLSPAEIEGGQPKDARWIVDIHGAYLLEARLQVHYASLRQRHASIAAADALESPGSTRRINAR